MKTANQTTLDYLTNRQKIWINYLGKTEDWAVCNLQNHNRLQMLRKLQAAGLIEINFLDNGESGVKITEEGMKYITC